MRYILFVAFSIISFTSFSQQDTSKTKIARNTIFFELAGNGGLYSLNYDILIFIKKETKLSARTGATFIPYPLTYKPLFQYPLELNFQYGKNSHLEIGVGLTFVTRVYAVDLLKIYDNYSYCRLRLGYRYQRENGGFFFKAGALPLLYSMSDEQTFMTIGLGFGYTF